MEIQKKEEDIVPPLARPILLIRSYEEDNGERPFEGFWWDPPDIEMIDMETQLPVNEKELEQGKHYRIRVTMKNIGTLPAFGTFLQIYIRDPFCTSISTLTEEDMVKIDEQIISDPILCDQTITIYSVRTWTPTEEYVRNGKGNPCLVIRTFIPIFGAPNHFDPRLHPSIAHQNLAYIWVESGESIFIPILAFSGKSNKNFSFSMIPIDPPSKDFGTPNPHNIFSPEKCGSKRRNYRKFMPKRYGILYIGTNGTKKETKEIEKKYNVFYKENKLMDNTINAFQKIVPRKKINTSFKGFNEQKYINALVEIPESASPGSMFSFKVEKWQGTKLVGGVTYILKVRHSNKTSKRIDKKYKFYKQK